MKYFYKCNGLYNINKLKNDFNFYDLMANWKDKKDNNKEKLGKFRLEELSTN